MVEQFFKDEMEDCKLSIYIPGNCDEEDYISVYSLEQQWPFPCGICVLVSAKHLCVTITAMAAVLLLLFLGWDVLNDWDMRLRVRGFAFLLPLPDIALMLAIVAILEIMGLIHVGLTMWLAYLSTWVLIVLLVELISNNLRVVRHQIQDQNPTLRRQRG